MFLSDIDWQGYTNNKFAERKKKEEDLHARQVSLFTAVKKKSGTGCRRLPLVRAVQDSEGSLPAKRNESASCCAEMSHYARMSYALVVE